jgi:DNA polymerase IV
MKPAVVRQAGWERSRALHSPAPAAGMDLAATAAAPGEAHHASLPTATHQTAPEAESGAAVVAKRFAGEVTTDADVAGMLGPAGVTRPEAEPVVLHIDIDAFFAAIEQQRDPRLQGRPVIVGAGVIASCSYEARRFGLRAGMTLSEAKRLCPAVVILEGHAQIYRCFAEEIFARCRLVSPAVETYLDEAYCDLSGTERLHGDLLETARGLKRAILVATGLTVTCGLGPNRMIAKLAGKLVKPDGLARVTAAEADAFVRDRPVEQIAGVGHAHAKVLRSMNVRTANDLRALPVAVLERLFGAPGRMLYERCRGRDTAAIHEREVPLSISRETSFHRDTADRAEIEGMLEYLVGRACRTARELGIRPRTVSLRLRYGDGESAEQARSLAQPSDADPVVLARVLELLQRLFTRRAALHAIGATLSNFSPAGGEQGALFDEREAGRRAALYRAFDGVRDHFGHGILVSGRALHLRGRLEQDEHGFILRTPSLTK